MIGGWCYSYQKVLSNLFQYILFELPEIFYWALQLYIGEVFKVIFNVNKKFQTIFYNLKQFSLIYFSSTNEWVDYRLSKMLVVPVTIYLVAFVIMSIFFCLLNFFFRVANFFLNMLSLVMPSVKVNQKVKELAFYYEKNSTTPGNVIVLKRFFEDFY